MMNFYKNIVFLILKYWKLLQTVSRSFKKQRKKLQNRRKYFGIYRIYKKNQKIIMISAYDPLRPKDGVVYNDCR